MTDEQPDDPARDTPTAGGTAERDAATRARADDDAAAHAADDDSASEADPHDRQLASRGTSPRGHVATMPSGGPQPPRRTGVFLDPHDLRTHVGELLRAMVGSYRVDAFGNFTFDHESARIFVTVGGSPLGPIVGVFAVTNTALSLDAELASWLARTNHRLVLGTLSWDDDNHAVWLRHNVLGAQLDPPELQAAVRAIASTAVTVGEEVHKRFGGRRTKPGDQAATTNSGEAGSGEAGPNGRDGIEGVEAPGFDAPAGAAPTNTTGYL